MGGVVARATDYIRKKLTKEEEYQRWITTIKTARTSRQQQEQRWRRWYNIADDRLWSSGKTADGSEPGEVNLLASILENTIPNISFREGKVEVRAFSQDDMTSAAIWEKAAKWLVQKHDLVNESHLVIYNALVLGDGLMKIGHSFLPMLSEPQWNAGLATERGANEVSVYGMEWPLFEFIPDYSATTWKRMRYFIHEFDKHIDEVKGNPIYNQVQVKRIKPSRRTDDLFYTANSKTVDKKKDYVPMQEIHDLVNARVMIVAEGAGANGYLFNEMEPFGMIPMERLNFFPRPMSVWGKGITQTIERHLVDLSKIDTYAMATLRKDALLKIAVDAASWSPELIKMLETSKDSVIPLAGDPGGTFEVLDFGSASDTWKYEQIRSIKERTIRSLAGSGRMQQGLHEVGVGSATETATLQANADVITKWRANKFSEFVSRVLEKMLFIVSVTYTPERIAQMVGYPVQAITPFLQPYDPSKYILTYGQAALADRQERQEKFMLFMQLFGQAVNPSLALQLASDIFDLEYTDEMLVPGMMLGGNQGMGQGQGGQQATTGFRPPESQE